MQRVARAIGHLAVGLAGVIALGGPVGCKKGMLGAGGAGQIDTGMGGGPGGRGGPGGGPGGSTPVCRSPAPQSCGAELCGNGQVDTCTIMPGPGCGTFTLREECDGAALGDFGNYCGGQGYASGTAVCGSTCMIDLNGCSECVTGLASVQSCGYLPPNPSSPGLGYYAVDATDSEVGLAEISFQDFGRWQLSFRRLTPGLAVASQTALLDGAPIGRGVSGVGVAAIPSGWVIATCVDEAFIVFSVDASGANAQRAAPLPATGERGCGYLGPTLVARPGGGPLMFWTHVYGASGALVAADGRSVGAPFDLHADTTQLGDIDAAWVSDAFQVATGVYPEVGRPFLRLTRIDPDGSMTRRELLQNDFYEAPSLARGAPDVRVSYVGGLNGMYDDASIKWRRLGPMDQILGTDVLSDVLDYPMGSPSVAFGEDTVVALSLSPGVVSIVRIGPDGQPLTAPYELLRGPPYNFNGPVTLVRRGPDFIASWYSIAAYGPARIGLARVTP